MWQPATNSVSGDKTIAVPLKGYTWGWSGTATNSASPAGWILHTSTKFPANNGPNADVTNEPIWYTNSAYNKFAAPNIFMKTLFRTLAFSFLMILSLCPAVAEEPDSSAISWEQNADSIAMALILRAHTVTVHVKNTSKTPKRLRSQGPNMFVLLYYVNDQGSRVLLSSLANSLLDEDIQKNPSSFTLAPGEEIRKTIAISVNELALMKTDPVVCTVVVYDPATQQQTNIESTPKILGEIPSK